MAAKTSQLQIRVTEQEKTALKRLAKAANSSVSEYVLTRALPSRQAELARLWDTLARGGEEGATLWVALDELRGTLLRAPRDGFSEALGEPPLERFNPVVRNQLAAIVEQVACLRSLDPPDWAGGVLPLARPHFAWSLTSLQPHQIRVTPVAFKRRGIFFDPGSRPGLGPGHELSVQETTGPRARLVSLAAVLSSLELKVEFYFLGGAILFQAFQVRPATANVSALFRPPEEVTDAIAALGQRQGWSAAWLHEAVKDLLVDGLRPERHFEAPSLAVFAPLPEYVLAVKIAALRLGKGARALDDVRYVLRGLNLSTPAAALQVAGRYFGKRQLPPDVQEILAGLLGP